MKAEANISCGCPTPLGELFNLESNVNIFYPITLSLGSEPVQVPDTLLLSEWWCNTQQPLQLCPTFVTPRSQISPPGFLSMILHMILGVGCHALSKGTASVIRTELCSQHLLHWQVSWFLIPITPEPVWYFSIKPCCVPSLKSDEKLSLMKDWQWFSC